MELYENQTQELLTACSPDHFCILRSQEVLETECWIVMVEPYIEKFINWNRVWPSRDTELLKVYLKINLHGFDEVNEESVGAWDRYKDALLPILVKGGSYTVAGPSIPRAFLLYRCPIFCASVGKSFAVQRVVAWKSTAFPTISLCSQKRGFKFAQLGYVPHCRLIAISFPCTSNRVSNGPPPRLARKPY